MVPLKMPEPGESIPPELEESGSDLEEEEDKDARNFARFQLRIRTEFKYMYLIVQLFVPIFDCNVAVRVTKNLHVFKSNNSFWSVLIGLYYC